MRKTGKSRIIMVSSRGHTFARTLDLNNLNSETEWAAQPVYSRTKLANILVAKELTRRLRNADQTSITVNSLDPGAVRTGILGNTDSVLFKIQSIILTLYGKVGIELNTFTVTYSHVVCVIDILQYSFLYLHRVLLKELRLQFIWQFRKKLRALAGSILQTVK